MRKDTIMKVKKRDLKKKLRDSIEFTLAEWGNEELISKTKKKIKKSVREILKSFYKYHESNTSKPIKSQSKKIIPDPKIKNTVRTLQKRKKVTGKK